MAQSTDINEPFDTRSVSWIFDETWAERDDGIPLDARLGAMVAIFFVSLLAVSLASLSKRIPSLRIPRIVFFAGKHFGTGIILSTAFCHLLQDAFLALSHPTVRKTSEIANRTGLIVLSSLLSIFIVEYLSTSFVNRLQAHPSAPQSPDVSPIPSCPPSTRPSSDPSKHIPIRNESALSISGSNIPKSTSSPKLSGAVVTIDHNESSETEPLLSAESRLTLSNFRNPSTSFGHGSLETEHDCGTLFFEGHHRHERRETHHTHHSRSRRRREPNNDHEHDHSHSDVGEIVHIHEAGPVTVKIGKRRQIIGILVLQLGIMIHSFVIGLTISVVSAEFASLVTAIIFHQLFEGLSLGIRIASLPASEGEPWHPRVLETVLSLLFAVTTPIGIVVGLLSLSEGMDSGHMKLTQGLMSAISAGMLIYSACVEMLAGDFIMDTVLWKSSGWKQALALVSLFLGVATMALVGR